MGIVELKWGVLLYNGYWGLFILHIDIPVKKYLGETSFTGMPGPIFAVPSQWHKATTRAAPSCCWGCSPPGTKHRGLWTDEPVFQGTTWSLWFCNVLTSRTNHIQWHLYWEDHDETWPNLEFLNLKTHTCHLVVVSDLVDEVPLVAQDISINRHSDSESQNMFKLAQHVLHVALLVPRFEKTCPQITTTWSSLEKKTSCQIRFVNILWASGCWKTGHQSKEKFDFQYRIFTVAPTEHPTNQATYGMVIQCFTRDSIRMATSQRF